MTPLYTALPANHCRLLQLISSKDDHSLRFRFAEVPITASIQRPAYTAISYAWANDATAEVVYIEDHPVRVRANVWSALHCLSQSWTYIWLDVLCINFNDTAERNEQVRLMDSIFKGAVAVSVWLGAAPFDSSIEADGSSNGDGENVGSWQNSLQETANRPYWSRSWVVPEYLLAQQVHLHCGHTRIDEHEFRDALLQATKEASLPESDNKELTSFPPVSHLPWRPRSEILQQQWQALNLVTQRSHTRYAGSALSYTLYDLITTHAYTKGSDPRDKVFSLIALLNPTERRFLERSFPDYNLTEDQVLITTLTHLCHFAGDRPLRPILKAFRIGSFDAVKLERVYRIIDTVDYMCSENPAQDIRNIIASGSTVDGQVVDELEPLLKTRRTTAKIVTAMSTLRKPFYEDGLSRSAPAQGQALEGSGSGLKVPLSLGSLIVRLLLMLFVLVMMLIPPLVSVWFMFMILTGRIHFCGWVGRPDDYFWQGRCQYFWRFG